MLTWKLVVGIALGAVLVKESDAVSKFYDSVRERAMGQLRTWLSNSMKPASGASWSSTTCDNASIADSGSGGGNTTGRSKIVMASSATWTGRGVITTTL